ncbi:polysaccharide deacetylase family protein [Parafilimonas sp.]|uniref:polysaccharide deacetylase family protein n=1 Tax=Parafilimonas sp. TaxID=1969739 RepID=UPI0039E222F2
MKLNSSMVWKMPVKEKVLFLTFDDGPHETATPFILDQLKKYNARATFFCLGKNVKAHPAIYDRILGEGHAVGNHTFSHLNGWKTKNKSYVSDIAEAAQCISSKLFRPPYGKISPFVARNLKNKLHYKIIMWHVLSGDFDEKLSPERCAQNVLMFSRPGSIIVFHDSTKAWERMRYALPATLQYFSGRGYTFNTIV